MDKGYLDRHNIDADRLPQHVAIIMDGNGRWAKFKNKKRTEGHKKGAQNLEVISDLISKLGIKFLTVYAFSTENWKRPKEEVDYLMSLLRHYLKQNKKDAMKKNARVTVIGDKKGLDQDLQALIEDLESATKNNTGLHLQMAINYGSRDELLRATKNLAYDVKEGNLDVEAIDDQCFESYLDTKNIPNPDLLIRTSGEMRISNFLLWQIAYAELYFADCYWPDFDEAELIQSLKYYQNRDRRFGGIK